MTTLKETLLDMFMEDEEEEVDIEKIDRKELLENLIYAGDVIQENLDNTVEKDKTIKLSHDVMYAVNIEVWDEDDIIYMDVEFSRDDDSQEDEEEAYKTIFTTEDPFEICKISANTKNSEIVQKVQDKMDELQEKFLELIKVNK